MKIGATIANSLWCASNLLPWHQFRTALRDPAGAQRQVLNQIVKRNATTDFGRQHRFGEIDEIAAFQRNVPIRDYEHFLPWIDRIRAGEGRVLTAEAVTRLATTSGSMSARKLIPYTASLQAQFNRAIGPWMFDLMRQHPRLVAGPAYWSISPLAKADDQPSKVPIGFEEDSEYLGGIRRRLVDAVMAVPASVRHAASIDAWRSQTIDALRQSRELRLISIWHPSFLSILLDEMKDDPKMLWPDLQVVSCWSDGHASGAANDLARRIPGVAIQPKGIIATEGMISIPFEDAWPIAIRSHFFEFLRDDGTIALAHELDVGGEYEVVMSTAGGLYRYRLADHIRVDARLSQTPSIRFIMRAGTVSDRFGEKLSEGFVASVIAQLQSEFLTYWRFALLAPANDRYVLYVEGDPDTYALERLERLLLTNPQYAHCRRLGQLKHVGAFRVRGSGASMFLERMRDTGKRLGDIKPQALSALDGWENWFAAEAIFPPSKRE